MGTETAPTGLQSAEVLPPTPARLRRPGGRAACVTACLAPDAVWVQHGWAVERLPLADLTVEGGPAVATVTYAPDPASPADARTLEFPGRPDGERWVGAIEARWRASGPPGRPYVPDGVSLVRGWPDVPHAPVGWIESVGRTRRAADQGLRLRAGARGADVVLRVRRERVLGSRSRRAYGLAVRVPDPGVRDRLRRLGYVEQVRRLASRMLLVLAAQAALVYLGAVFLGGPDYAAGPPGFANRHTPAWLGAVFGWPAALVMLLWATRAARLLRAAGLAVLAATAVRGLAGITAHLLAVRNAGPVPTIKLAWLLANPIDWVLMAAGLVLSVRAWRLAAAARDLLPAPARAGWAPGTLAVTAVYLLAVAGWAERATYDAGSELLRNGVDPVRERQARWAYRDGVAQLDRGNLAAAERSFQEAQAVWGRLTDRPEGPPAYHGHLALTHYQLGVIHRRQGRTVEAVLSFRRADAIGSALGEEARTVPGLPDALAECRSVLADWRDRAAAAEKERKAWDLYEDAMIKSRKQDPAADDLFRDAIALWEELLAARPTPEDRKVILPELARAYLRLAAVYQQRGRVGDAEPALRRAVARGEEALALGLDRPRLVQDNLDMARDMLDQLRGAAVDEEIDRLVAAARWVDAAAVHRRAVAEQEERVRAAADREAAARALAARLDRYAWFLAHCPDDPVRNPAAAVRHAGRATELDPAVGGYWFTLAAAHYRNGQWRDSQVTLAELKERDGELDAGGWFLTAMNLHRLGKPADARTAFRKGTDWMDRPPPTRDAARRAAYELLRPTFESLRHEAVRLLEGKDPGGDRIGSGTGGTFRARA